MLTLVCCAILLAALSTSAIDEESIIKLKRGSVFTDLKTPDYPYGSDVDEPIEWIIQTESESKLKIHCEDFRLTDSEDCLSAYLKIEDNGNVKTYCSEVHQLTYTSVSSRIVINLGGNGGQAAISCIAKSIELPEPDFIDIVEDKAHHLEISSGPIPFFDKIWHFQTKEHLKIQFRCFINLLQTENCHKEVLKVYIGIGEQIYCGAREEVFTSENHLASIRLELGRTGIGKLFCSVQATKGAELLEPSKDEIDTVRSLRINEEDSSEHGGKPGPKGTTCNCGWANKPRSRIIRGKEASPNEYPWMVALKAYFGEAHIDCGGSIITHRHVLTAAHCLLNMFVDMSAVKPEDLYVIVGAHDLEKLTPKESVKQYQALKHFIRQEFIKQYTHDIAIVVVKDEIEFTPTVGPICLSPKKIAELNKIITIIGWGKTETGKTSKTLLKAKTAIIDRKRCDCNLNELCTRADKSATCTGDSGGPLSWLDPETNRYTLMSLVSYGDPDCVSTPSVSTDVFFFYDWIQDTIKATFPEEMTCVKKE